MWEVYKTDEDKNGEILHVLDFEDKQEAVRFAITKHYEQGAPKKPAKVRYVVKLVEYCPVCKSRLTLRYYCEKCKRNRYEALPKNPKGL